MADQDCFDLIVLVCGGRAYKDVNRVYRLLDKLHHVRPIELIVTGACTKGGADLFAENWAKSREVNYIGMPAKWKTGKRGKGEGMARNKEMLRIARPHMVIAFPGQSGTFGMINAARKAGVFTVDLDAGDRLSAEKVKSI